MGQVPTKAIIDPRQSYEVDNCYISNITDKETSENLRNLPFSVICCCITDHPKLKRTTVYLPRILKGHYFSLGSTR